MEVQRIRQFDGTFYKYETLYERKEILDEIEKEYLSGVIRPFRDRIVNIAKMSTKTREYISIFFKGNEDMAFPTFEKNIMYKRMQTYKEYTLEELGI